MKHEIDNIGLEQEQKHIVVIENKIIEAITDSEALGVYIYIKMLADQGITQVKLISEYLCEHFSMSEINFLKNITYLNGLGFMMVIKQKE